MSKTHLRAMAQTLLMVMMACCSSLMAQALHRGRVVSEGKTRSYWHQPAAEKGAPLIIALHGGGGNGRQLAKYIGMAPLAKAAGFAIAFPDGLDKHWVDGRDGADLPKGYDDVKFIRAMMGQLAAQGVDTSRVYVTGISNGGFMSIHLGWKLGRSVRAIAPVCAGIPANQIDQYALISGTSVLMINGMEDPLVPFQGGPITLGKADRGETASTQKSYEKFQDALYCSGEVLKTPLEDKDPADGCTASLYQSRCPAITRCRLVLVTGGGHTWPGARQYLPVRVVGRVCRDFDATQMILDFFKEVHHDKGR